MTSTLPAAPREFSYLPLQRVIYGDGAVALAGQELERLGAGRALIVTGTTISTKTDLLDRVRASLGNACAGVFDGVRQHVPRRAVLDGVGAAREARVDALVSLGGGSAIDCAKGIALVLAEGERWDECRMTFELPDTIRVPRLTRPKLPHLAIPTTLSGAEFTHIAGITRADVGTKEIFLDPQLVSKVVVLDPAFTLATGPTLWASTGIKALDHCVESVYSLKSAVFTDALCFRAVRLLFEHLGASLARPDDLVTRLLLQQASWLACYGITNTWVGLGHALCHQVGAMCGVPHGVAAGILLPHAMAFNRPATVERQALLAEAMGIAAGGSAEAAAVEAMHAVAGLVARLGLPARLRDVGIAETVLAVIAEHTARDFVVYTNPRKIRDQQEILDLLRRAW
jgi:alcohol dehydrogenase class IV